MTIDRYNEIMSVLDELHRVISDTVESIKDEADCADQDVKQAA